LADLQSVRPQLSFGIIFLSVSASDLAGDDAIALSG
jgi:hypothetical protein